MVIYNDTYIKLSLLIIALFVIVGGGLLWYGITTAPTTVPGQPSHDTTSTATDVTGTLYISGIPDNDFNHVPATFSMTLPGGKATQISALENPISVTTSYINHQSGNRFMLLQTEPFGDIFNLTIPAFVLPNTPHNTSQNDAIPFKQEALALNVDAGILSHSLIVSEDSGRIAFVTHFSDVPYTDADLEKGRFPNLQDFAAWTLTTLSADTDEGTVKYFSAATNPVFATNNHLVFMTRDAIYVYDFQSDVSAPLVTAAELGFTTFSPQDTLAIIGTPDNQQLLVYKHNTAELIFIGDEETDEGNIIPIINHRTTLPGIDGRTIFQLLTLTPNTIATLYVNPEDNTLPDLIAIYDVTAAAPTLLHTYSMGGITKPGTTMLDSFSPGRTQ